MWREHLICVLHSSKNSLTVINYCSIYELPCLQGTLLASLIDVEICHCCYFHMFLLFLLTLVCNWIAPWRMMPSFTFKVEIYKLCRFFNVQCLHKANQSDFLVLDLTVIIIPMLTRPFQLDFTAILSVYEWI